MQRNRVPFRARVEKAERKWLDTYKPPARISGKHITPIDPAIYAGVGGFNKLNEHPR